jgi:hypothetical protein
VYNVGMGQFTLRRLFVSIALVASGVGMGAALIRSANHVILPQFVVLPTLLASPSVIGAGIGNLLKRPWVGALAGLITAFAAMPFGFVENLD